MDPGNNPVLNADVMKNIKSPYMNIKSKFLGCIHKLSLNPNPFNQRVFVVPL